MAEVSSPLADAESCSQSDCPHADSGSHCMVRACPNFKFSCPRHG
jgi:hypothetical protein